MDFDVKSTYYGEETIFACSFEQSKQEQVTALLLPSADDVMTTA